MAGMERYHFGQQTVADWTASDGITASLPGGVSVTDLHVGDIELLGAVLR